MERLTDENGICVNCEGIAYCRTDCFHKKVYDKLKHYEDLEEHGKLEVCASKDKEVESLKKRCSICLFYTGERHGMSNPCNEKNCLIYRRLEELGLILI